VRNAWFEDGPEEIAEGVYRVPMTVSMRELHAVNVYVRRGEGGVDLVDAGDVHATDVAQLDEQLARVGHRAAEIGQILVTHIHPDHYSLAPAIRTGTGARILLGEGERANLESLNEIIRGDRELTIYGQLASNGASALLEELNPEGMRPPQGSPELEGPDVWAGDGQVLRARGGDLTTIHTPGHTRGHLVFRDEARNAYYTGDHVLPHITPSIGLESTPAMSPLTAYLVSLDRMLDLPDGLMLPAHGPAGTSVHARVRELIEHHDIRLADTRNAVEDAGSTAYEVAARLKWTSRSTALPDIAPWHRYLATTETAAHLRTLVERGLLQKLDRPDGPEVFVPAAGRGAGVSAHVD
jgi:glyoxylase-like metal-dependent hydrolase (beta-lactamase superfamily II)